MNPERWKRINTILERVLSARPSDQDDLIEQTCSEDPLLGEEVRSLLQAHRNPGPLDELASFLYRVGVPRADLPDQTLEPGSRLRRYRILDRIARGGMGEVYLAEDTRLGRQVAIKTIALSAPGEQANQERLLREARSTSALNHPNIVTIHSIERWKNLEFIVMEYVDGETLKSKIARGDLTPAQVFLWGTQIARALDAAHAIGVAHRDIKPANVMITSDGRVKLLDFGLAKIFEGRGPALGGSASDLTVEGMIVGTVAYMSPEQARGDEVDWRTDLFSLGTVLYEAATGELPFQGEGIVAVMHAIATRQPRPPCSIRPELPAQFDRLIDQALAKEKEQRFHSAAEMAEALQEVRLAAEADPAPFVSLPQTAAKSRVPVETDRVLEPELSRDFKKILAESISLLQELGRVTYRTLKRQFDLNDEVLEDLKLELIHGQRVAADEGGQVLVWRGSGTTSSPSRSRAAPGEPRCDMPHHLVRKILEDRRAVEGERKRVTLLLCECRLGDSSGEGEPLGPEARHRMQHQFFELALRQVHRYEGSINSFQEEGFTALFGVPIAHEDHARRGVLCAVSLREALESWMASRKGSQETFSIRVAVHTGEIIVGAIGDNLRMKYTSVGGTSEVTEKLKKSAGSGQILMSQAAYRLAGGFCTTRAVSEPSAGGKVPSEGAWEVLSARETKTRLEVRSERGLSRFVGRARELEQLQDCFQQTLEGRGQIVFLVGEAGIGKSRLLREFRSRVGSRASWIEGHATSFGRSMPFHPLIDLLRRTFGIEKDDPVSAMAQKIEEGVTWAGGDAESLAPYLLYLLSGDAADPSVQAMDPKLRRAETFQVLQNLLLLSASQRPQIVVFEDLHWIDRATEEFLLLTVDRIPSNRVLLILTCRPDCRHRFGDRTYRHRISLAPLAHSDTLELARAELETKDLSDDLADLILSKGEGNPFFVEEVIGSLREMNALRQDEDGCALARPADQVVIPHGIGDLLMSRIDRLEEGPKKTLQLASVVGREFGQGILEELLSDPEALEDSLHRLKAIELIHEKVFHPEPTYLFKHALTQEVAYQSLLEERRIDMHRQIAEATERLQAERLADYDEILAYHFASGRCWKKALEYLLRSAEKASLAFATADAMDLYDQALEVAGHLGSDIDGEIIMRIHEARSRLAHIVSDFETSRLESERLLALAEEAEERLWEARALNGIAWACTWARDLDRAVLASQRAIEKAGPLTASRELGQAFFNIGFIHAVCGEQEAAERDLDKALNASQEAGDAAHCSLTLATLGLLRNWTGEYESAAELQAEGLNLARQNHLLVPLLFHLFMFGMTRTGQGQYDTAQKLFLEGLELAEKVGDEAIHHRILNCLGWLHSELADWDRSIELNSQSAEVGRRRADPGTVPNAELNLGEIFLARGDLKTAQEFFDKVLRYREATDSSPWMRYRYSIRLFADLGELWLQKGNMARAGHFVDRSLSLAESSGARKILVRGWRLKGQIATAAGEMQEAERLLRRSLAAAVQIGNPPQLWKTQVALGDLYSATAQVEQARRAYLSARDLIESTRARLGAEKLQASLGQLPLLRHIRNAL